MVHLDLREPVQILWFGEFISPAQGWVHLTRRLLDYELMIVTEGILRIADEDREYEVSEGEYLLMSPTHFQHGTRECRCRFFWMHFRCPALPATMSLPTQGIFTDADAIRAIARKLMRAEAENARGLRSRYLASELLFELEGQNQCSESAAHCPAERLCAQIKEFVFFHRFSDVKVQDLARELGYHEKYISAVFHATEGITLKHYLMEQRLAEAKRLLLESAYSVAEIALSLHFPSPHNFSRFFKQAAGMTAGEFRAGGSPVTVAESAEEIAAADGTDGETTR